MATATATATKKFVYSFGGGVAEGKADRNNFV